MEAEKQALAGQLSAALADVAALRRAREELQQENAAVKQNLSELEGTLRARLTELERTFEATQADCIVLLDLRQRRIRELEVWVSRSAAKADDRRKRFETLLITERNERNALELQLQEAIAHVAKHQDADRLAEEAGRLSAVVVEAETQRKVEQAVKKVKAEV
jgi:hypothetical protein